MSYKSFLQDDSYYKGSVHKNDTSIPTLRVVNRCFEEDTELDSYQRFINMQPLSLKTGLFGTVKLINDRDANKKTKTVGQHQKQERKNRFQTGNYPSNKNASASRELRALSEMKLSKPSKTLYPNKNSEDTKDPKKSGNLFQREDDSITAEKKNKVNEEDMDQSILYQRNSFEEDKKLENFYKNETKVDGGGLIPSTSCEDSNEKKEFLGKKTDRPFFDSKKKDKSQNKNNSDNKLKDENKVNKLLSGTSPTCSPNINDSIKDNKKVLDKKTEEIEEELNNFEKQNKSNKYTNIPLKSPSLSFNKKVNKFKAEESEKTNFNGTQDTKNNKNEANICLDINIKFRRDNSKISIRRSFYNKYLNDINIEIKNDELKLDKFSNVKEIDITNLEILKKLKEKKWKDIIKLTSEDNKRKIDGIYKDKIIEEEAIELLEMPLIDYYNKFLNEGLATFLDKKRDELVNFIKNKKYGKIIDNLKENNKNGDIIRKFVRIKGLNAEGKKQKEHVFSNTKDNKIPKELKNVKYCYYNIKEKQKVNFENYANKIYGNMSFDPTKDSKEVIEDYIEKLRNLANSFFPK